MINFLIYVLFSVMQTIYAWHLLTCPESHSQVTAFLFTLTAGGFWTLALMGLYDLMSQRKK